MPVFCLYVVIMTDEEYFEGDDDGLHCACGHIIDLTDYRCDETLCEGNMIDCFRCKAAYVIESCDWSFFLIAKRV